MPKKQSSLSRKRVEKSDESTSSVLSFLSLPVELRLHVYHLLLPHNSKIRVTDNPSPRWCGDMRKIRYTVAPINQRLTRDAKSLFLICKQIQREAYGVLYGSNQFTFLMKLHFNPSIRRSRKSILLSFKPISFFKPGEFKAMKNIEFEIDTVAKASRQQSIRRDLEKVAAMLGNDHLLEVITVRLATLPEPSTRDCTCGSNRSHQQPDSDVDSSMCETCNAEIVSQRESNQYCLEPLASVYGLKEAHILGSVTANFSHKLSAVMKRREPTHLPVIDYGTKTIARKKPGGHKRRRQECDAREWYQPRYNWAQAEELGIQPN